MTTPPDEPNSAATAHGAEGDGHDGARSGSQSEVHDEARAALELRLAERGLEVIRQDPEFVEAMKGDAELRALAGALAEIDAAMPLFEGDRVPETLREAVLADARMAVVRPAMPRIPSSAALATAGEERGPQHQTKDKALNGSGPDSAAQTSKNASPTASELRHVPQQGRNVVAKTRAAVTSAVIRQAARVNRTQYWTAVLATAAVLLVTLPFAWLVSTATHVTSLQNAAPRAPDFYDEVAEFMEVGAFDPRNPSRPRPGYSAREVEQYREFAQLEAADRERHENRNRPSVDQFQSSNHPAAAPRAMEPEPALAPSAPRRSQRSSDSSVAAVPPPPPAPAPAVVEEIERGAFRGRREAPASDAAQAEVSSARSSAIGASGALSNAVGTTNAFGSTFGSLDVSDEEEGGSDEWRDDRGELANLEDVLLDDLSADDADGDGSFDQRRQGQYEVNGVPGSTLGLAANGRGGGAGQGVGGLGTGGGGSASGQDLSQLTNQIGAFSQIQIEQNIVANNFVVDQQNTVGVRTQAATGYWQNTYVPGDPSLRRLADRVYADDAAYQLASGISALERPFDPPTDAALAVTAHGSRARTNGETRMVVQVGLQATERSTGRRPAMSIAVVLDLRADLTSDEQARVSALLQSLSSMQETGDRISLVVAGEQGGVWIEPGEFRYGTLAVAAEALADGAEGRFPTESLGLQQALREGGRLARSDDDPNSPLGSSVVVLVTPERATAYGLRIESLERDAHERSVAGVPTSVVSLAPGVIAEPLALAGGGQRWTLSSTDDAERVATGEIEAVSGIVARAVRLRIRLAPGVRLVDVLGSESLNEQRSERVRQAEQAADQRISRSMGIASDRGEDEDGIQIVVPAFRVGDDHTVLLDVIVPGAGPVLDVTVRYKDLVHLKNGVAQTTFSVRSGDPEPLGPLELAVWEDVANFEVAERLNSAADSLAGGGQSAALSNIDEAIALLDGLPAALPGFVRTHAWQDDRHALLQLRQAVTDQTLDPSRLSDALRFAHAQKLYPMPGTSQ